MIALLIGKVFNIYFIVYCKHCVMSFAKGVEDSAVTSGVCVRLL